MEPPTPADAVTESRERIMDALSHRQPDRVPIDFGTTGVTGIHVQSIAALREHYGLERRPVKVHEPYQMLGLLDEDLQQALGVDVAGVYPRNTLFGFPAGDWKPWRLNGLDVLVPGRFEVDVEPSGDTVIYPEGDRTAPPSGRMPKGFHFFDTIVRQDPIVDETLRVEDNLEEFGSIADEDVTALRADVAAARATGRAVIANFGGTALGDIALVPAPFLKHPTGIRDVTEWYMSLNSRRRFIHELFDRQVDIAIANLDTINRAMGDGVDIVFLCGTDFGTQSSAFCSVATFRELWLPYYTRLCDWIHRHTAWKVFKHSCGSVERFYESFVEAGIDIVNPVQCSAKGMDPEALKAKYGGRLVFWGGGVDTQKTLPFGTPAEVRAQVLRRCEIFAPGGGFVFNAIHNVQAGTPVQNVVAMFDAVHEFNGRN